MLSLPQQLSLVHRDCSTRLCLCRMSWHRPAWCACRTSAAAVCQPACGSFENSILKRPVQQSALVSQQISQAAIPCSQQSAGQAHLVPMHHVVVLVETSDLACLVGPTLQRSSGKLRPLTMPSKVRRNHLQQAC